MENLPLQKQDLLSQFPKMKSKYLPKIEKRLEIALKKDCIELSKIEIQHQTNSRVKKKKRGRVIFRLDSAGRN